MNTLSFLGDSLTWGGYGGGDWVAEIRRLLPDKTVINAGYGGDTVLSLLERLDAVLEKEPDAITVMVGGNDALSHIYPDLRKYYRRTKRAPDGHMPPELFAQYYRDLLTYLQLAHVQTYVMLPPIEYSIEAAAVMQQYNEIATMTARSLAVPVFDLYALLMPATLAERPPLTMDHIRLIGQRSTDGWTGAAQERAQYGFTFSFDGIHFTSETAKLVAPWVVAFMELESKS